MPGRIRRRLRLYWPHCRYYGGGPYHHPYGYGSYGFGGGPGPGPWVSRGPTLEEEKEDISDYIEMLKEELAAAEEHLKDLEKEK